MKEKSLERGVDGFLILLLPIAFAIVIFFTTWPLLLGLAIFSIGYKVWQYYQWQQWSRQVNPIFLQVIQANQGRIAPLDLAIKANLSAATAKYYLDSKAAEFGAQRQEYKDLGTVYYFITSSTLGSMLDKSEPLKELEPAKEKAQNAQQIASQSVKQAESLPLETVSAFSPTPNAPESATSIQLPQPDDIAVATEQSISHNQNQPLPQTLIQSELAKRLNVYSSTVYKRRDDPDFPEWTRSRDPDGISWGFSAETKEFYRI
ncbi:MULTISPECIES: hypothetical protein [Chroococcidiopsis]|uniref:Uncharacterized protein n=1 Tax=Chroococcidiopsis thermalis (strain PCC 7203) TaxID=251229 RepID=K9U7N2_CHRTP|nr:MULTISPECIES: hypothetical protein [Chroococcidiopsis]AFY90244.1 hypothetical protein Chro_4864 [Chroococcidiopsis thermalis PCC 7203]MBE9019748.1 hypothetical protein [Chroococcidiopsidales cyanobacterium LEGE 13417]PSB40688.1 hypothetical protein C7B80_32805 [Cyanosarcina cf. burmensis CCALA 770]PSM48931.1 hypothetical protein C7Y66_12085 [Chroococcidiopsis sp. CCALA 051]